MGSLLHRWLLIGLSVALLAGCESTYYSTMERLGIEKREILVDRVSDARDSQAEAQQQFASALEEYASLVNFDGGDLQRLYDALNDDFEQSEAAAQRVSDRIDAIERVADALFTEWQDELELYSNGSMRRDSEQKLRATQRRYSQLLRAMRTAEQRMQPVINGLRDNVLYLKHNLNASAIGALKGELDTIESDIEQLLSDMASAIAESDAFIASMTL